MTTGRRSENWALWRDAGDWERFATLWHPAGRMEATWLRAGYRDFIEASRTGFDNGVRIWHFLGGHTCEVAGDRAVARTKMTIAQRASVEGEPCDVVRTGRFYDFLQRYEGRWTSACASLSTSGTASTRSARVPSPPWTTPGWLLSPRATVTSPTRSKAWASTSSSTCRS